MRLIYTIVFLFITYFGWSQNLNPVDYVDPNVEIDLTYNKPKSTYVSGSADAIIEANKQMQINFYRNKKTYDDFINEKLNALEKDTSSIKYKSEIYALGKFINYLKPFQNSGRWEDAYQSIETAKSNYYTDMIEFITNPR